MNHEDERNLEEERAVEAAWREEAEAEVTHAQCHHVGQDQDLATLRGALQLPEAQRALERVAARLLHAQRFEPVRAPNSASIVATWDDIKELFHILWGQCASGKYDKGAWKALQGRLERLERATESLGPDGREQLIGALRRIDEAFR